MYSTKVAMSKKLLSGNIVIEVVENLVNDCQCLSILNTTFLLTSLYLFRLDAVKYVRLQRAQKCKNDNLLVMPSRSFSSILTLRFSKTLGSTSTTWALFLLQHSKDCAAG